MKKVVLHDGFDGESHSWKGLFCVQMKAYCFDCIVCLGYDLALLQLYPSLKDTERFPNLKPVCLPFKNKKPSGNGFYPIKNRNLML